MAQSANLIYQSGKTYTHAHGFSCCFRQWKASSHCSQLHGYSLQVELIFEGDLNDCNWVQDFGGLKPIKTFLESMFDHTLLVAEDDPQLTTFQNLGVLGLARVITVPAVGCEKFAELIFEHITTFATDLRPGNKLKSVTVREHAGNHATVTRKG